jgi:hydroxypyruvate reductase
VTGGGRAVLLAAFDAAVAAAHPSRCLPRRLPPPPAGRLILLAAGKAGASMAAVAEAHYREQGLAGDRLLGLAVTRHGYGEPAGLIPVVEAGHPVPDAAGVAATLQALRLAEGTTGDDLVLVLLSGGGSANWIAPAGALTLPEKGAITRALLRSGAAIGEINTVRKHLSRIKGGRLARLAFPAPVLTLAISDVPGDDPAVIASGPTVPDPSTLADARAIAAHRGLALPRSALAFLDDPANETPKPATAPSRARSSGSSPARRMRSPPRPGSPPERATSRSCSARIWKARAREIAGEQARLARQVAAEGRRAAILSGGELTVTIRGQGRGGPNQEYALALAIALEARQASRRSRPTRTAPTGVAASPRTPPEP